MGLTTIHDAVRDYYGKILAGSDDLHTNATSCHVEAPPRYVAEVMPLVADEVIARFYGCGSPIPPALEGATVLDLGCGTGRDVYVLSKLVGPNGHVIGVDMTDEQLDVARRYQDYHAEKFGYEKSNVEFRLGYIEDLASCGIADESIDLVVSNCVVNLSPFKELVMSEVFRVLKPGGELYFADVYASRRLPEEVRNDPVVRGECLGGATYAPDFEQLMHECGFPQVVWTVIDDMYVGELTINTRVGFTSFTSRTLRAIKCAPDELEPAAEDYGQHATYLGGMPEMPRYFDWSCDLRFVKDRPCAIDGNTARMLAASRYGRFFEITPEGAHRGAFDAERAQQALEVRQGKRAVDLRMLEDAYERAGYVAFDERVGEPSLLETRDRQTTMQVNLTYACNLSCEHCYLECGPRCTEAMSHDVMQACLDAFEKGGFETMDVTGGSPEMHPEFEWFLRESAKRGDVIVRTNLTLLATPKYAPLMDVFAEVKPQLVASLPFYDPASTDTQRGSGVFERSIEAVRALNERGFGMGGDLRLDLVYNVAGAFLPQPQDVIEATYHKVLERDQGVHFDSLFAFNNWPLGRFAAALLDAGMFDDYLALLANNFNAMAVTRLMCLDMVNVDYDGRLYDCEVNHVLALPLQLDGHDATIFDLVERGQMPVRTVRTNPLCYSCAAGFGSSCGGALIDV